MADYPARFLRGEGFALTLLLPLLAGTAARAAGDDSFGQLMLAAEHGDARPLEAAIPGITDPATRALAQARLAASRLDTDAVRVALSDFKQTNDAAPAHRAMADTIATDAYFAAGRYSDVAEAARDWLALPAGADPRHTTQAIAMVGGIANSLATAPKQVLISSRPATVPAVRDRAGLTVAPASVNGTALPVVLDTGANLSTVSASTAARLGLHMVGSPANVGTATRDAVAVRIGVAGKVELAGVTLKNVAFLVLDDAQLQLPLKPAYQIEIILGFPVFRAMGRITFTTAGGFSPDGGAAASPAAPNMHLGGSDLFVDATVNGLPVSLHLDTGATATSLSPAFAKAHPDLFAALPRMNRRIGGAGGVTEIQVARLEPVDIAIADKHTVLNGIDIELSDGARSSSETQGTLGQDVLRSFAGYTVDFASGRFTPFPAGGSGPRP
ncbi:MAG TPA: aspartyl protease family protein [Alphaproteobacteria bacterium]|nr:aspartyl protease family protein [Alphaproteobacteria bacterium]